MSCSKITSSISSQIERIKTRICDKFESGTCRFGDSCKFAHVIKCNAGRPCKKDCHDRRRCININCDNKDCSFCHRICFSDDNCPDYENEKNICIYGDRCVNEKCNRCHCPKNIDYFYSDHHDDQREYMSENSTPNTFSDIMETVSVSSISESENSTINSWSKIVKNNVEDDPNPSNKKSEGPIRNLLSEQSTPPQQLIKSSECPPAPIKKANFNMEKFKEIEQDKNQFLAHKEELIKKTEQVHTMFQTLEEIQQDLTKLVESQKKYKSEMDNINMTDSSLEDLPDNFDQKASNLLEAMTKLANMKQVFDQMI